MSNVTIIDAGKKFGNMNTNKKFYKEGMTKEEIQKDIIKRRIEMGKYYGFNGLLMYMADQKNKNGSYFEITDEYVRENPNGWTDIDEDILIINKNLPGVCIGHPIADCPVIIMSDLKNNVTAIGHCSAELVDMKMPIMIADALQDAYKSRDEDIVAYVSSCAGPNWSYDSYPKWALDKKLWEDAIILGKDKKFYINLRNAIIKEFKERNIKNVRFSPIDTINNPNYYSNSASSIYGLNDQSKAGRNFVGAFYKENNESAKAKTLGKLFR